MKRLAVQRLKKKNTSELFVFIGKFVPRWLYRVKGYEGGLNYGMKKEWGGRWGLVFLPSGQLRNCHLSLTDWNTRGFGFFGGAVGPPV